MTRARLRTNYPITVCSSASIPSDVICPNYNYIEDIYEIVNEAVGKLVSKWKFQN